MNLYQRENELMAAEQNPELQSDDQKQQARKKENNPFSEQEKHGPDAHRLSPGDAEEYQGDPSVQRQTPGVEGNTEEDEQKSARQGAERVKNARIAVEDQPFRAG
jgi:hypothetical protein